MHIHSSQDVTVEKVVYKTDLSNTYLLIYITVISNDINIYYYN